MRATLCFAALAGLVLLGTPAFAGCPFAGFIMSGGSDEPPPAWHQGLGRKLQQAKCNVAALAAQPAAPAPIIPQGEVDALVKQVALEVFLNGVPGFVPGLYPGGKLATKLPLGGLLRVRGGAGSKRGGWRDCLGVPLQQAAGLLLRLCIRVLCLAPSACPLLSRPHRGRCPSTTPARFRGPRAPAAPTARSALRTASRRTQGPT